MSTRAGGLVGQVTSPTLPTFGIQPGPTAGQRLADQEARRRFFEIRLWNADDLVQAIQEQYEKLAGCP